jgi:hypothetical protein
MNETCMDNGYSVIVEWKEFYWSPLSAQGFELFVKNKDVELHLSLDQILEK